MAPALHVVPAEQFPRSVGGFDFGLTPAAFVKVCKKSGSDGKAFTKTGAACLAPAVLSPFPGAVYFTSCGKTGACEYQLHPARESTSDRTAMFDALTAKYGVPTHESSVDFKTVLEGCANPGTENRAYVEWFFGTFAEPGSRGEIRGLVRFVLFCSRDANGVGSITTSAVYQNRQGVRARQAELASQEANY